MAPFYIAYLANPAAATETGKARDLPAYINPYREQSLPEDYRLRFMKYDWTINQQPDK